MSAPKPTFKPIDLKRIEEVVAGYAAENNVPALTFPSEVSTDRTEGSSGASDPSTPKANPTPKRAKKQISPAPARRLAVELPDYLFSAVSRKAAEEGVTKRFVVLQALRAAGYVVNDIDFNEDGRRV